YNSRCWARALAGQLGAALTDCDESLRLRPNDANTFDSRALAYLKLGRYDEAISDYSAALELNPQLASSLYGRGVAKVKRGDADAGNADIAAAKAIQADIADDFTIYGVTLADAQAQSTPSAPAPASTPVAQPQSRQTVPHTDQVPGPSRRE